MVASQGRATKAKMTKKALVLLKESHFHHTDLIQLTSLAFTRKTSCSHSHDPSARC